jgi:hypothetical protein
MQFGASADIYYLFPKKSKTKKKSKKRDRRN